VQALAQRLAQAALDGAHERDRHRAELDLEVEAHAAADRRRVDAQPTVARNGLGSAPRRSTASPAPVTRSMQIVVVSRKLTAMA